MPTLRRNSITREQNQLPNAPPTYSIQDGSNGVHYDPQPAPVRYTSYDHNYGAIIPPKPTRQLPFNRRIWPFLISILLGIIIGYMVQTPLDSRYRQLKRAQWASDEEQHKKERVIWENWVSARETEKRKWDAEQSEKRSHIEWQGLQRHSCVRYGTREYTATLIHVPLGFDAMQECKSKSLTINGRQLYPSWCEDEGYCGKATAHWDVDFNEPACTPFFSEVLDKGCNGAFRRYDARLENIQEWDSWQAVCSTMSTAYGSVRLGPGASCSECNVCRSERYKYVLFNQATQWGRCGHWATWMIEDSRCR